MSTQARTPRQQTATSILEVAVVRGVQMYRAGADEQEVYWVLLHAGLTAELVLA